MALNKLLPPHSSVGVGVSVPPVDTLVSDGTFIPLSYRSGSNYSNYYNYFFVYYSILEREKPLECKHMTEQDESESKRISELWTALYNIIYNIRMSSEEEGSSPLPNQTKLPVILSALKNSLFFKLLCMTGNEWRVLDYIKRYKVITVRSLQNFLRVGKRQIYNYLSRLERTGFLTYTEVVLTNGPPTRFYHFDNLLREDLLAAESLEKAALNKKKRACENSDYTRYVCQKCGQQMHVSNSLDKPKECPRCKHKEVELYVDKGTSHTLDL